MGEILAFLTALIPILAPSELEKLKKEIAKREKEIQKKEEEYDKDERMLIAAMADPIDIPTINRISAKWRRMSKT